MIPSCIALVVLGLLLGSVDAFHAVAKASKNSPKRTKMSMKIFDQFDALLFDCDGVIAETERDVHRISFNQAFKHKGLSNEWDADLYGKLLKIGGGKERMTGTHYTKEVAIHGSKLTPYSLSTCYMTRLLQSGGLASERCRGRSKAIRTRSSSL